MVISVIFSCSSYGYIWLYMAIYGYRFIDPMKNSPNLRNFPSQAQLWPPGPCMDAGIITAVLGGTEAPLIVFWFLMVSRKFQGEFDHVRKTQHSKTSRIFGRCPFHSSGNLWLFCFWKLPFKGKPNFNGKTPSKNMTHKITRFPRSKNGHETHLTKPNKTKQQKNIDCWWK